MNKFTEGFTNRTNRTFTEKGAVAKKTTDSYLLDFFAQGGALRKRPENDIQALFDRALNEDMQLALRAAFYIRDVRGGQGERRTFRVILNHLADRFPGVTEKNLEHVPFYGRWDDLYSVFGTRLEGEASKIMLEQIMEDLDAETPSLCAKWLASENASSDETTKLARKTMRHFGWTPKKYRKTLSHLRKKIGVVERKMSAGRWDEINFEGVPSKAAMIYKDAFKRHCPIKYQEYLDGLESGETTINASTLFPYELVRQAEKHDLSRHERTVINEQWKALPDYIGEKSENSIAVVDTSGSMSMGEGLAKQVALSVGLYLAERNTGPYHNRFITFSNAPEMIEITGSTFIDKVNNMWGAHWDGTTDIEAVFKLILQVAVDNHLSQDEIPSKLYIISDMEFDAATSEWGSPTVEKTLFQKIRQLFEKYNYDMPDLVFWNVDARNQQFPMSKDERGFQLVSGCSPSIFEATMKGEFKTAYEFMLDVIDAERYQRIKV